MKTFYTALLFLLSVSFNAAEANNYINSGSPQAYNLNSGDTLRIVNNTYNGNINTFQNGAVIIVTAGSTFKPGNFNSPAGKVINYGICEFNYLNTSGNFKFDNYGILNVNQSASLYDGARQVWTNNIAASISIKGNFDMSNALVTNHSTITVGGTFNMYKSTSDIVNTGVITVARTFNMNDGTLTNENIIRMDALNLHNGEVINKGEIAPTGTMTINGGTNYTNSCLLITNAGLTNNGDFKNNGLLWVGRTGTSADKLTNNGSATFTNGRNAVVRTVDFVNHGEIKGAGSYYVTGNSYNGGTVGTWNIFSGDWITFYDVTRTSSSRIFDTEHGTVWYNVIYRQFAEPDTNEVSYGGCSAKFRSDLGSPLPIEWNYFDAKSIQNKPVLTWSAQYEANMTFEVEKSTNNEHFTTIASTTSNNTAKYSYIDEAVEKGTVVYYRIKGTSAMGAIKYTETKTVKIAGNNSAAIAVYPNPTRDVATIQYKSEKSEQVMVRVSNAGGQQLLVKNVMAVKGSNAFGLSEAAQLKAGIYFVEIINNNGIVANERFIKN